MKVKRKTDISHYSAGTGSFEFPLKEQVFEVPMNVYQALMDYFIPMCSQCNKEFESYPDFAKHSHSEKK